MPIRVSLEEKKNLSVVSVCVHVCARTQLDTISNMIHTHTHTHICTIIQGRRGYETKTESKGVSFEDLQC